MEWAKFRAVFFDFDGVIVETVPLKLAAFEAMFAPFGESVLEKIRAHTLHHGGISRKEKIPFYYSEYIGQPLAPDEAEALSLQYSNLVKEQVVKAELVPGVLEFLAEVRPGRKVAVITGTPQDEIDEIVAKREMGQYFDAVCGSPDRKPVIIRRLLDRWNLSPAEVLFIGDSFTDYEAARETRIEFLLRDTEESRFSFESLSLPCFREYHELLESQAHGKKIQVSG